MKQICSGIAVLLLCALSSFCGWVVFAGLSLQAETFGAALVLCISLSPYLILGLIALGAAFAFIVLTNWRCTQSTEAE